MIAHAEASLGEFIEQWDSDLNDPVQRYTATLHLASCIGDNEWHAIGSQKVLDDYFQELDFQDEEVANWIFSDKIFQLMEAAYFRWQDEPDAGRFSDAHKWLDYLRKKRSCKQAKPDG